MVGRGQPGTGLSSPSCPRPTVLRTGAEMTASSPPTRHADPGSLPSGYLGTIVIDPTPSRRADWLAGQGRDEPPETDDTPERREGMPPEDVARIRAEVATARAAALQEDARPPAVWTYGPDGSPIYDDDPRLQHVFPNGRGQ